MNPEIKKRWVDALRSGKYKQGQKYLWNQLDGTYCCLGVLTDLYCQEKGVAWSKAVSDQEVLPPAVVKWAELDNNDPGLSMELKKIPYDLRCQLTGAYKGGDPFSSEKSLVSEGKAISQASHWNDSGATFEEIASMIERTL